MTQATHTQTHARAHTHARIVDPLLGLYSYAIVCGDSKRDVSVGGTHDISELLSAHKEQVGGGRRARAQTP